MKFYRFQTYKDQFLKLISLDDSSVNLALSFAIGLFISLSPAFGAHTALGFLCVVIFRMNLPAIMIGVWVNGPVSAPFVYAGFYYFGRLFLGGDIIDMSQSWHQIMLMHFKDVIIQVTIGWLSIGLIICPLSYWLVKTSIDSIRRRRHNSSECSCEGGDV